MPEDRTQLFLRHLLQVETRLYSFIRSQIRQRADAEDLLQETVAVLWTKFDQFQPDTSFLAWACQTARYKISHFHRREKSRSGAFSIEFAEAVADAAASMNDELDLMRDALAECMCKLRPADRAVFEKCYAGDDTIAEVAVELGRPLATVKSILQRVRRSLLECIRAVLHRESKEAAP